MSSHSTIWRSAEDLAERADLPTPFLAVSHPTLIANISRTADLVSSRDGALVPHLKTHKCEQIAALQREHGARAACVATVSEARAALQSGFEQVMVAYPPIGLGRLDALTELSGRCEVIVVCSRADHVRVLADSPGRFDVYWEVDSGTGRLGTAPGAATAQALAQCSFTDRVRLAGLMTFAGHAYAATTRQELLAVRDQQDEALVTTRDHTAHLTTDRLTLSVGVTPFVRLDTDTADEYRYGNYVFHDATQVAVAGVDEQDCSLAVITTVLDTPDPFRAVVDAGSKGLSPDSMTSLTTGHGIVIGRPDLTVVKLYEEHGLLRSTEPHGLRLGQRLAIIPNHACTTVNLHPELVVFDASGRLERWPVTARR